MPCTPNDAALLQMTASNLLPSKTTPILVHCAAGRRAAKAKEVLDELGYETVVNGGGFDDVAPYVNK
jgi:phage shock protein E